MYTLLDFRFFVTNAALKSGSTIPAWTNPLRVNHTIYHSYVKCVQKRYVHHYP